MNRINAPFALIGGLALASHQVIRATQDVDMLTDLQMADAVHTALLELGYHCLYRSKDAANYLRNQERADFLYASKPVSLRLLQNAKTLPTAFGELRVVSGEGLIGFKLQGWVNDPRRTQDMEDIRALLRQNHRHMDLTEVRDYFRLFDREALLDELLNQLG